MDKLGKKLIKSIAEVWGSVVSSECTAMKLSVDVDHQLEAIGAYLNCGFVEGEVTANR